MNRIENKIIGEHKGISVNLVSTVNANGKLVAEDIELDKACIDFVISKEDNNEYFDWIDSFCEVLDSTGQFDEEVLSWHLGIE